MKEQNEEDYYVCNGRNEIASIALIITIKLFIKVWIKLLKEYSNEKFKNNFRKISNSPDNYFSVYTVMVVIMKAIFSYIFRTRIHSHNIILKKTFVKILKKFKFIAKIIGIIIKDILKIKYIEFTINWQNWT